MTDVCLAAWREYPELYEGNREEYLPAFEMCANSPYGVACALFDGEKLIGIAIGTALGDKVSYFAGMLTEHGIAIEKYYYLSELVVLKEYRSRGYGRLLYEELEEVIKRLQCFSKICFCKDVDSLHPELKPEDYYDIDPFWISLGYVRHPLLILNFHWRDLITHEIVEHPMSFWTKTIKD